MTKRPTSTHITLLSYLLLPAYHIDDEAPLQEIISADHLRIFQAPDREGSLTSKGVESKEGKIVTGTEYVVLRALRDHPAK